MNRQNWKKTGVLVLCGLFLFVSLISASLSIHDHDHGPEDEPCLLCCLATGAKTVMKALSLAFLFGCGKMVLERFSAPVSQIFQSLRRVITPVEMKVKMLN